MKYNIVLILIFGLGFVSSPAHCQTLLWTELITFDYSIEQLFVDRLNNIYTLDEDSRLRKYNNKGIFLDEYYNTLYGTPTSVNVTNPFQPLIFYSGISKIVSLDANLGTVEEIQLNELNLFDIGAISRAMDGNFWVFDNIASKIKKINVKGDVLVETLTINMLWNNIKGIDKIVDNGNFAIGLVKGQGVIVLDVFGNVQRKILQPGIFNLFVIDQHIYMQINECEFVIENLNSKVSENLDLRNNLDCIGSTLIPGRNLIGVLKNGSGKILVTKNKG